MKTVFQNKVPASLLVLLLIGAYIFLNQKDKDEAFPQESSHNYMSQKHEARTVKKKNENIKKQRALASNEVDSTFSPDDFSYKEEVIKVRELAQKLPQSESTLIKIISREDYFKAHAKEVKPHSFDEITQNQMGAIKVLALKALLSQGHASGNIKRSLNEIIQKAKDPTIVNIAKAALDSEKKGRSFFDDFTEGIDGMAM